jgi:hypothetical protein
MTASRLRKFPQRLLATWLIAAAVLALAFYLGRSASPTWLGLIAAGIGGVLLLARPVFGLPALVLAALVVPLEIGTGTDVKLNPVSLLLPVLLALWLLDMVRRRQVRIAASAVNRPLLLFVAAGLLSLLIGRATWDLSVPISGNFLLVQLAQWAIFAFSAGAFWLTANLVKDERGLWQLTAVFLVIGGGLAILRVLPGVGGLAERISTVVLVRSPFWALLTALAGGQLLFNPQLTRAWRIFLVAVAAAAVIFTFVIQSQVVSHWVGVSAAWGLLIWLRWPRLRMPLVALIAALAILGFLFPSIYQFAGGDQEWNGSGESRLVLISRVVEVTMRSPITGLGPAAYRLYANMRPIFHRGAYWVQPLVNSHNNYVDLFAHGGLLGLALFTWFVVAFARLGIRLQQRHRTGFAAGYVNAMLAVGFASLALMMFADWILPFVYNIGFPGFQASVLVWLFLGGLVMVENLGRKDCLNAEPSS